MKKFFLIALSLTMLLVFSGCTGTTSTEGDTFSFAMSGLYKPFNFQDQNGELIGFDVEIGKAIAERMGMKAEPVTNPWDTILVGLNSDKYDAIIGSMAITAEREENADFSRPYYRSGAQVFIAEDNSDIKTVDDIRGVNIGVVKNSTYGKQALQFTDAKNVFEYDSDLTALQDLKTGRVQAVITDQMVGFRVIKEGSIAIKDIGEPLSMDEMGIPVKDGNTELLAKVNQALEEIIADGTYEEISKKWFGRSILGE